MINIRGRFKTEIKRKEINQLIKHTGFSLQRSKNIQFAINKAKQLEERMNELIAWIDESDMIEIIDECPFFLDKGCDAYASIGHECGKVHYKCYKEAIDTLEKAQNGNYLSAFWHSTLICMVMAASFSLFCTAILDTRPSAVFYIIPQTFCLYYLNHGGKGGKIALVYTLISSLLSFASYVVGMVIVAFFSLELEYPINQIIVLFPLILIDYLSKALFKLYLPEIIILLVGLVMNSHTIIYKKNFTSDVIESTKVKVKRSDLDDSFNYHENFNQQ